MDTSLESQHCQSNREALTPRSVIADVLAVAIGLSHVNKILHEEGQNKKPDIGLLKPRSARPGSNEASSSQSKWRDGRPQPGKESLENTLNAHLEGQLTCRYQGPRPRWYRPRKLVLGNNSIDPKYIFVYDRH